MLQQASFDINGLEGITGNFSLQGLVITALKDFRQEHIDLVYLTEHERLCENSFLQHLNFRDLHILQSPLDDLRDQFDLVAVAVLDNLLLIGPNHLS